MTTSVDPVSIPTGQISKSDISGPTEVKGSGTYVVTAIAVAAALISLWFFYSHGWSNIYGDGISRLNGTRKLLDWQYPDLLSRYLQIGTPWLPLPYFLMAPFVAFERLWRTGLAG